MVVLLAAVVYARGGASWLTSPAIWGVALGVALIVLVVAPVRRHLTRSLLLGVPIMVGGAAAIYLGAWDYLPWLTSPALWLGILASALIGYWLVRTGQARPRDVIEGTLVGLLAFGLALVVVYAGVLFVWVVWRPLG